MSVKCKKNGEDYLALRITIEPYVLFPIIILILVGIYVPYVQRTNDWNPIYFLTLLLLIYSWISYTSMRYRIWWEKGRVYQRSGDMIITSVDINDIKEIKQESSDLATLAAYNRPSKRITLYAETSEGPEQIDVSLIHFKINDVKGLMRRIHEKRPDLEMPKGWG